MHDKVTFTLSSNILLRKVERNTELLHKDFVFFAKLL